LANTRATGSLKVAIPPAVAIAIRQLDPGKAEVIALAASLGAAVLLDDAAGRRAAQALRIPFPGFTGLLFIAKQKGPIAQVTYLLLQARSHGYWLSDELIITARKLAEELNFFPLNQKGLIKSRIVS